MGGMFRSRPRAVQRIRLRRGSATGVSVAKSTINSTPVERVLTLLHHLGQVLLALIFKPHRLDETINGSSEIQRTVPKYTFLTVAIFAAVKTCKFVLMLFLIVNLEYLRGCDPVEQQPMAQPLFQQELVVPSLVDIMLVGLPSALLIIVLLSLVRALLRLVVAAQAARRFYNVSVYIAGFQYALFAVVMIAWLPIRRPVEKDYSLVVEQVPSFGFVGALAWGALLLAVTLLRVTRAGREGWTRLRRCVIGLLAWGAMAMVSLMVLAVGPIVALPLATREIEPDLERPVLAATLLDVAVRPDGWPRARLLVTNLSGQHRYIEFSDVVLLFDDLGNSSAECSNGELRLGRVREWQEAAMQGQLLAPRDPLILTVDLFAYPRKDVRDCGLARWSLATGEDLVLEFLLPERLVRYTPPENYLARIRFRQVDSVSGKRGGLAAFLVGEDEAGGLRRLPENR